MQSIGGIYNIFIEILLLYPKKTNKMLNKFQLVGVCIRDFQQRLMDRYADYD